MTDISGKRPAYQDQTMRLPACSFHATWTTVGSSSNGYLQLKIDAPQVLTAEVVNSWVVLVYDYTSDFSGWGMVPYHTERGIEVNAQVSTGYLLLKRSQDGQPYTQSWHDSVKVVAIQPSAVGALDYAGSRPSVELLQQAGINVDNYDMVKSYFRIP